jgi:hypothetical protein
MKKKKLTIIILFCLRFLRRPSSGVPSKTYPTINIGVILERQLVGIHQGHVADLPNVPSELGYVRNMFYPIVEDAMIERVGSHQDVVTESWQESVMTA